MQILLTEGDMSYKATGLLPRWAELNIDANIQSTLATVLVTQTFTNSSSSIKESNYLFPLYEGSAPIAFRCYIGDNKVLHGVVKAKDVTDANGIQLTKLSILVRCVYQMLR